MKNILLKRRLSCKIGLCVLAAVFAFRLYCHIYYFTALRGVDKELRGIMLNGNDTEVCFGASDNKYYLFPKYVYNNSDYRAELYLKRKYVLLFGGEGYVWYEYKAGVKKGGVYVDFYENKFLRVKVVKDEGKWKPVAVSDHWGNRAGANFYDCYRPNFWEALFYGLDIDEPCLPFKLYTRLLA